MLYLIPGLGADYRVYANFITNRPSKILTWIDPIPQESISNYCRRLLAQIDLNNEVEILGMSFGGIIAQELAKLISVKTIFLVSSVTSPQEYPLYLRIIGKLPVYKFIPTPVLIWSNLLTAAYYFGTTTPADTKLLKNIIADTNHIFLKWAINCIANWQNEGCNATIIQIHGNKDRIFPIKHIRNVNYIIPSGTHWMIVDKKYQIITIVDNTP